MGAVVIVKAGLQTTIQDLGRWGHQASGVPVAGAMDAGAHRTANALVNNPRSAATCEITLTGPELHCDRDALVAVCGAVFEITVGGRPVPSGEAIALRPGERLTFGDRRAGARAYLAIDGGFAVPEILGSRSTYLAGGFGGFEGRALRAGDRIPIGAPAAHTASAPIVPGVTRSPEAFLRETGCVLRVLPGPDLDRFADDAFDALVSTPFVVRSESNRMGYRLRGARLGLRATESRISDATPIGTIQVPPVGEPVLLMADRPTTGGYAAIANVITADLDRAAQLVPGDSCRFARCSMEDALGAFFDRERRLEAIEGATA